MENQEKGIREKTKFLECPHCHETIKVVFQTRIMEITKAEDEVGNIDWTADLTKEQLDILDVAREHRIVQAFEIAARVVKTADQFPKNMERFFLTFLRTAIPKTIPRFALDAFRKMYGDARISFIISQGIGAVLADGKLRLFIPQTYVMGKVLSGSKGRVRTSADENEFILWIRNPAAWVVGETQSEMLGLNYFRF